EVEGTLLRVLIEPGKTVEVGTPIAVVGAAGLSAAEVDGLIAAAGADPGAAAQSAPAAEDTPAPPAPPTGVPTAPDAAAPTAAGAVREPAVADATASGDRGGRIFASPLVRKLARERGLDLA